MSGNGTGGRKLSPFFLRYVYEPRIARIEFGRVSKNYGFDIIQLAHSLTRCHSFQHLFGCDEPL